VGCRETTELSGKSYWGKKKHTERIYNAQRKKRAAQRVPKRKMVRIHEEKIWKIN